MQQQSSLLRAPFQVASGLSTACESREENKGFTRRNGRRGNEGGGALKATSNSCQFGCLRLLFQHRGGEGDVSWWFGDRAVQGSLSWLGCSCR